MFIKIILNMELNYGEEGIIRMAFAGEDRSAC